MKILNNIKKFPITVVLWLIFAILSVICLWNITPNQNQTALAIFKMVAVLFLGSFVCSRLSNKTRKVARPTNVILSGAVLVLSVLFLCNLFSVKVLIYIWQTLQVIAIIIFFVCIGRDFSNLTLGDKAVITSYALSLAFVLVDFAGVCFSWWGVLTLTRVILALTLVDVICYFTLAIVTSLKVAVKAKEIEAELKDTTITVMISQIQPHFLYNSLNTIAELCVVDPRRAEKATIDFARYLRGNMSALDEKKTIEFEDELRHLNYYVELEKLRYGSDLEFVYDINATDFTLPALTVQPLVENAVNHGIRYHKMKGKVTISSYKDAKNFYVSIKDNGVGFDPRVTPNDGRKHVGIANVKYRLEVMCGGSLIIDSEQGKGTQVTVVIPKEK
jgi:hypothetical protein